VWPRSRRRTRSGRWTSKRWNGSGKKRRRQPHGKPTWVALVILDQGVFIIVCGFSPWRWVLTAALLTLANGPRRDDQRDDRDRSQAHDLPRLSHVFFLGIFRLIDLSWCNRFSGCWWKNSVILMASGHNSIWMWHHCWLFSSTQVLWVLVTLNVILDLLFIILSVINHRQRWLRHRQRLWS